jgi:hypothetical protein
MCIMVANNETIKLPESMNASLHQKEIRRDVNRTGLDDSREKISFHKFIV